MRWYVIGAVAVFVYVLVVNQAWVTDNRMDGSYYMYASQSLLAEGKLLNKPNVLPELSHIAPAHAPFTLWPPLWPVLLTVGQAAGVALPLWVAILNAFAFAIVCVELWIALTWLNTPRWLFIALPVCLLTSPFIRLSMTMILSEPLFMALMLGFFLVLIATPDRLFLITVLGAALVLTRYVGVAALITGIAYYWIIRRNIIAGVMLGVGAGVPLLAWLLRNYALTETLMGPRFASTLTVNKVQLDYLHALSGWIKHGLPIFAISIIAWACVDILLRRVRSDI